MLPLFSKKTPQTSSFQSVRLPFLAEQNVSIAWLNDGVELRVEGAGSLNFRLSNLPKNLKLLLNVPQFLLRNQNVFKGLILLGLLNQARAASHFPGYEDVSFEFYRDRDDGLQGHSVRETGKCTAAIKNNVTIAGKTFDLSYIVNEFIEDNTNCKSRSFGCNEYRNHCGIIKLVDEPIEPWDGTQFNLTYSQFRGVYVKLVGEAIAGYMKCVGQLTTNVCASGDLKRWIDNIDNRNGKIVGAVLFDITLTIVGIALLIGAGYLAHGTKNQLQEKWQTYQQQKQQDKQNVATEHTHLLTEMRATRPVVAAEDIEAPRP